MKRNWKTLEERVRRGLNGSCMVQLVKDDDDDDDDYINDGDVDQGPFLGI